MAGPAHMQSTALALGHKDQDRRTMAPGDAVARNETTDPTCKHCRSSGGRTHRKQRAKVKGFQGGSRTRRYWPLLTLPQTTQHHMQREVGVATHNSTPTGSLPTSPHMGEGHSRATCATMRWGSHPPNRQGSADRWSLQAAACEQAATRVRGRGRIRQGGKTTQ